jgi:acyl dehydratase
MIHPQYFEDYQVGSTRETLGRTMTETDIVLHAGQSGDFYPHHMDAEWCKGQEFGQRMAHGTLVFTMAVGLTAGDVNPEAFTYGYDRLRFIKPVFIGDTIYSMRTLLEKTPKYENMGLFRVSYEVFRADNEELVLYTEHLQTVLYRTSQAENMKAEGATND